MKTQKVKMKKCAWECIAETGGRDAQGVFWCADCGAIQMEDGRGFGNPARVNHETYLCPDQGVKV